MRYYREYQAKD